MGWATGELKSVPDEVALFMGVHSPEFKELPKPRAQPVLDRFRGAHTPDGGLDQASRHRLAGNLRNRVETTNANL